MLINQDRFDEKVVAPRALVKGLLRRDQVEQQPQPVGLSRALSNRFALKPQQRAPAWSQLSMAHLADLRTAAWRSIGRPVCRERGLRPRKPRPRTASRPSISAV
jgi:hypothetical protein